MIYNRDLNMAVTAAIEAGRILEAEFHEGSSVRSDIGKDIKLASDVHAETRILEILRSGSEYPILSEESGADSGFTDSGKHWIVDPLDGTFNFSRGIPLWSVSIALWRGNEPVLGVVHEPLRGSIYSGLVGTGAWDGEQAIRVSNVSQVGKAALATGFPVGRSFKTESLHHFVEQVASFKKVRLVGSAAISLSMLASGSIEAYQEDDIQYWDVAAGLALVAAAGGRFDMKAGSSQWQRNIVASNGCLPIHLS
jgi:myo-inositol-1(or 4)-monophosphatase